MTKGEQRGDAEIVKAVLDGDREAYSQLVRRYQRRILHAMWRATGNRDDAEELSQAVFCRAYFALASFDPQYRFSSWIFRIAHNLSINHLKRGGREVPLEDLSDAARVGSRAPADPDSRPEEHLAQREIARSVRRAIAELPEEFREVIALRHLMEMSYVEIGEALELPMGTVKSRIARGRKLLAERLAEGRARPESG